MRSLAVLLLLAAPAAAADPPAAPLVATLGTLERKLAADPLALRVHPDGRRASILTTAGGFSMWDLTTGLQVEETRLPIDGQDVIQAAVISGDGRWVFAWSQREGLFRYDAREKRLHAVEALVPRQPGLVGLTVALSADGRAAAAKFFRRESRDKPHLAVWDVADGEWKARFRVETGYGPSLAFSPDGRWLAHTVPAGDPADPQQWRAVNLVDAQTGRSVRTFGRIDDLLFVTAFSKDGRRLATRAADTGTRVWDTATGEVVREWKPPAGGGWAVFAPDGGVLVGPGRRNERAFRQYDLRTGAVVREFPAGGPWLGSAAFTPDGGTFVAAGGDRVVRVWDAATGAEKFPAAGHAGKVRAVAWLPDGGLVTGGADGTVRVWTAAGAEQARLPVPPFDKDVNTASVTALAVSPDGARIAVGQAEAGLRVWDWRPNRVAASAKADFFPPNVNGTRTFPPPVEGVAFAADGQRVRVVDGKRRVTVFSPDARPLSPRVEMPREFGKGDDALIRDEPFVSPDAGVGVAYYEGNAADEVRVWDFAKNELRAAAVLADNVRPWVMAVTPNGRLAVAHSARPTAAITELRLCALDTFAEVGRLKHAAPWGFNPVAAVSADSRLCAAWEDRQNPTRFVVFDLARGTPLAAATAPTSLTCVAFAPDGRRVAAGAADSRAFVFDLRAALDPTPPTFDAAACWADLVAADGAAATRAVYRLADHPAAAVKLFREKLKPAAKPPAADVEAWVKALDAAAFADRQAARKSLTAAADAIEPELRAAAANSPSPEATEAIAGVLAAVARSRARLEGDHLRAYRVVQTLEAIGPPAAGLLAEYAAGAKGAYLTQEATAARGRVR